MIKNVQKRSTLEKILQSPQFQDAKISQKLLTYLVNSSIKRKTPKEISIARDVFDKDETFNPSDDTLIRVHIHKLRKKLESYYKKDGQRDRVKIIIPKGHYEVCFVPRQYINEGFKRIFNVTTLPFIIILVIIMALMIYLVLENQHIKKSYQIIAKNNPIWREFFQADKPVLLVLGDFFFIKEFKPDLKRGIRIRDVYINSPEELQIFKEQYPEYRGWIADSANTFIQKDYAFCLQDILQLFFSQHERVQFRLVSNLTPKDLVNYHIIFLGNFKYLGILEQYFTYSNFKYDLYSEGPLEDWEDKYRLYPAQKILYRSEESDSVIVYTRQGSVLESHTDYAIVSKFPAPNKNVVLMFSSFYSAGIYEAVKTFTNLERISHLQALCKNKFKKIPQFFELLIEASGVDRTGYQSHILQINSIPEDLNIWSPASYDIIDRKQ